MRRIGNAVSPLGSAGSNPAPIAYRDESKFGVIFMSNKDNVQEYRKRQKRLLIEVLGGKCQICGFDKFQEALEFHHEYKDAKEFGISEGTMRSTDRKLREIKKCYLLCSNCHKGVHYGYYDIPREHIFIQSVVDDYMKQRTAYVHTCVECGTPIDRNAIRCVNCANKARRNVERPSREQLKTLIRANSITAVGKMFKVTANSIKKWCKSYSIPCKKSEINRLSDADWSLV